VTYLDNAQSFFGPIAEVPCLSELRQAWYVQTCPEIVGTEEIKKKNIFNLIRVTMAIA
jgi:hypothetical protein